MPVYCIQCGTSLPDDAKFCFKCGKEVPAGSVPQLVSNSVADKAPEESWLQVGQSELFRGEELILTKNANAIIRRSDYNMDEVSPGVDFLLGFFGMQGTESIGGRLHLTNYRFIFKSHAMNRVKGKFSIFLPTIKGIKDASVFLSKKIKVFTQTQNIEFVIWGIPQFIAAVEAAKGKIDPGVQKLITEEVASNYTKCGSGLEKIKASEVEKMSLDILLPMVKRAATGQSPIDVTDFITASNVLNLIEILRGF